MSLRSHAGHGTAHPNCVGRPGAAGRLAVVLSLFFLAGAAAAQTASPFLVGLHLEKNASYQPGVQVSYQNPAWLGGHPRLTLSYATTRLATAAGSNDLVKDRVQLSAGWYFRPQRSLQPYGRLVAGYERFGREDDALFALLDNTATIVSVLAGLEARFLDGAAGLYGDAGFSLLSASTVYPFVYSVGVNYRL